MTSTLAFTIHPKPFVFLGRHTPRYRQILHLDHGSSSPDPPHKILQRRPGTLGDHHPGVRHIPYVPMNTVI